MTAPTGLRPPEAVRWAEDGAAVDLLDQTLLPEEEVRLHLRSADAVVEAIRMLRVRGAPAIGIAAAMALAVEARRLEAGPAAEFRKGMEAAAERLRSARPTAVNLAWAIERMQRVLAAAPPATNHDSAQQLHDEAQAILDEDRVMCQHIGEHALDLLAVEPRVLTHCNAGALATGGIGTALAPLYLATQQGRRVRVWASETRPLLQGSRLTVWELERAGIDVTLVPDSAAALVLRDRCVDAILVGADRIARNGDVANKLGTYALAILARHHGVPFYVAAPTSTIDPAAPDGGAIPIEHRDADEVRRGFGRLTAPASAHVFAPAFDVTPASLIDAIVTEAGVMRPPYTTAIQALFPGET
ncbi:MAG: S-methyl-5-thioribose-1-phosphate isomerase [Longimicrobiales bacterium]